MLLRVLCIWTAFIFCRCVAEVQCPTNEFGVQLKCSFKCCKSLQGKEDYFCCGMDDRQLVAEEGVIVSEDGHRNGRPERFVAYGNAFQIDYTLLVIGLIVSIVLSILFSFFCCLLCNGCWLHRRRNPQMYESVNENGSFYPICCGFGIPTGTVVFSTHPPQFRDESGLYHGSSTSSLPSSRNRVRFNEDGTPKGVLKNGNSHYDH